MAIKQKWIRRPEDMLRREHIELTGTEETRREAAHRELNARLLRFAILCRQYEETDDGKGNGRIDHAEVTRRIAALKEGEAEFLIAMAKQALGYPPSSDSGDGEFSVRGRKPGSVCRAGLSGGYHRVHIAQVDEEAAKVKQKQRAEQRRKRNLKGIRGGDPLLYKRHLREQREQRQAASKTG